MDYDMDTWAELTEQEYRDNFQRIIRGPINRIYGFHAIAVLINLLLFIVVKQWTLALLLSTLLLIVISMFCMLYVRLEEIDKQRGRLYHTNSFEYRLYIKLFHQNKDCRQRDNDELYSRPA